MANTVDQVFGHHFKKKKKKDETELTAGVLKKDPKDTKRLKECFLTPSGRGQNGRADP